MNVHNLLFETLQKWNEVRILIFLFAFTGIFILVNSATFFWLDAILFPEIVQQIVSKCDIL